MRFLGGLVLGLLLGVGATLFLTKTELGQDLSGRAIDAVTGLVDKAPDGAGLPGSIEDLLASAESVVARAEEIAGSVADGVDLDELSARLEAAAEEAGATAGALAIRANELALEAAEALPDLDALGGSLQGWQEQLAAYEMALHADDVSEADSEASERDIAALFAPATRAEASEAAEGSGAAPFDPHSPFYKCPVIEVSNSGPANADRVLTNYTPWVETPAGVLIRAPVEQACLSSGYGRRQVNGASKSHAGVDYYNREGGVIYAAGDGVVTLAGEDGAYGQAVRIDHGDGVEGLYAHMVPGSIRVRQGEQVRLGQPIGMMGRSGRAYAVHLHYELRFAGDTVDPMYVGKRASF